MQTKKIISMMKWSCSDSSGGSAYTDNHQELITIFVEDKGMQMELNDSGEKITSEDIRFFLRERGKYGMAER